MQIKRIISTVLIIPILLFTSGCASYRFGRLPSPYIIDQPTAATQKDISVAVKFFSASEATSTFDCEMAERKINPVYITIENKGNAHYAFRKTDVDSSFISGEEAAKKCSRSTMGRVLGYGFLGLFIITWIIFIPMAIAEAINCPKINSQMRSDYTSNEIADGTIGPGHSLSGVMFVAPLNSGTALTIPLINRETGERLLFQFQYNQPVPITPSPSDRKEDRLEKKEPQTNFAPQK